MTKIICPDCELFKEKSGKNSKYCIECANIRRREGIKKSNDKSKYRRNMILEFFGSPAKRVIPKKEEYTSFITI